MKRDDWQTAMEHEAQSVDDLTWAVETRWAVRQQRLWRGLLGWLHGEAMIFLLFVASWPALSRAVAADPSGPWSWATGLVGVGAAPTTAPPLSEPGVWMFALGLALSWRWRHQPGRSLLPLSWGCWRRWRPQAGAT